MFMKVYACSMFIHEAGPSITSSVVPGFFDLSVCIEVDANILDTSVHTVEENTDPLVAASQEIGLEVNADKTKYMVVS